MNAREVYIATYCHGSHGVQWQGIIPDKEAVEILAGKERETFFHCLEEIFVCKRVVAEDNGKTYLLEEVDLVDGKWIEFLKTAPKESEE